MSKEVGPGAMTGHGWPKYAKDESGDNSSDSYAEPFRNEGLDVEGLGMGKIQGDQEHDTAEHAKKRVRRESDHSCWQDAVTVHHGSAGHLLT